MAEASELPILSDINLFRRLRITTSAPNSELRIGPKGPSNTMMKEGLPERSGPAEDLPFALQARLSFQGGQTEQPRESLVGCPRVLQPVVTQLGTSPGPCLTFVRALITVSGVESHLW